MNVVYVTGNSYKFEIAKKSFEKHGIELIQKDIETPEIQSMDVEEIAAYSARWAANQLNIPVIVSDAGWYFDGLNGFPGPFIKFVNKWFTAEDYLRLFAGVENRNVTVKGCYAYCEPGKEPKTFVGSVSGTIALQIGEAREGETSINQLFIPAGKTNVSTELPHEEMVEFWSSNIRGWEELVHYLTNKLG